MAIATEHLTDVAGGLRWGRDIDARSHRPMPRLTLSEWADKHRILSRSASAEPGRWRTDRAPYQRGIMDAISDPTITRVVIMKPAQVGYTEILGNAIGYYIHQDPAPMLIVQPTVDMAKAWSVDRLKPMLEESPVLKGKVANSDRRSSNDTILHKIFPGGHITMVGANSATGLASRPIRVVFFDEVDRFPDSAGDEGDPIKLGEARTRTFHNRKIVMGSTPTIQGMSRIEAAFKDSDQRHRYLPCPDCGTFQVLRWANLKFQDVTEPCYACAGCGVLIPETKKGWMDARGEWRAHNPGVKVAGFHLNALYSPWAPWADLADEFTEAERQPSLLQAFVNLVLGECWDEGGGAFDIGALMRRRESYNAPVPAPVAVLTAGVDVQRDRLECVIRGWGEGEESWRIGYWRLYGDPTAPQVWKELDDVLLEGFAHESGGVMKVAAACVDSGYATASVYDYVRHRIQRRIYASKGLSTIGAPLLPRKPSRANKEGIRLVTLGVDAAKDLIYGRLKQKAPGPGFYHFDMAADKEYFDQLTAERRIRRRTMGRWVSRYEVLPNMRNEALDTEVYAIAAFYLLGGVRQTVGRRLVNHEAPVVADVSRKTDVGRPMAAVVKVKPRLGGSGWISRW